MSGNRIVEEELAYDGGRRVSVCLPPAPPSAVVFAADGRGVAKWGEALVGTPIAIVGVHGLSDEMQRLEEYSPVFDAEKFAAHERFFVDDVRLWARERFDIDLPPTAPRCSARRLGESSRLRWASGIPTSMARFWRVRREPATDLRLPSRPRYRAPTWSPEPRSSSFWRTRIGGRALEDAGAEVVFVERDADHGSDLWRAEFPLMLEWAFG